MTGGSIVIFKEKYAGPAHIEYKGDWIVNIRVNQYHCHRNT